MLGRLRGPGLLAAVAAVYVSVSYVSNAAEHSPPGTTVLVAVASEAEVCVAVRVTDARPGFTDRPPEQLFELFYRANAINPAPGAGTGLFVCRKLVQAMGGRIWAAPWMGATATSLDCAFPRSSTPKCDRAWTP